MIIDLLVRQLVRAIAPDYQNPGCLLSSSRLTLTLTLTLSIYLSAEEGKKEPTF